MHMKECNWNLMIHHGATISCFYTKEQHGSESPWMVVDKIIQPHWALLVQEELVDLGERRDETSAGKLLSQNLENILNKAVRSIGNIGGGMRRISMQGLRPCACGTRISGRGT